MNMIQTEKNTKNKDEEEEEICDVATAQSPFETTNTAVCATPNKARRVIRTIDGQQLILCADDVKYLSVIDNMFTSLKALNSDATEEPFVIIPISIQSSTMMKIIDWSRAAKKNNESSLDFCQFFPDLNIRECLQILEASLFLETNGLGKSAGKWLAAKLEGKSSREMAQLLEVPFVGLNSESKDLLAHFNLVTPGYLD